MCARKYHNMKKIWKYNHMKRLGITASLQFTKIIISFNKFCQSEMHVRPVFFLLFLQMSLICRPWHVCFQTGGLEMPLLHWETVDECLCMFMSCRKRQKKRRAIGEREDQGDPWRTLSCKHSWVKLQTALHPYFWFGKMSLVAPHSTIFNLKMFHYSNLCIFRSRSILIF